MNKDFTPHDKEFFIVFADAIKEGIALVRKIESENKYVGSHYKLPSVTYKADGMPDFSMFGANPTDYGEAFGLSDSSKINYNDIPAIKNFVDFAKAKEYIQNHFKEFYKNYPSEFDFFETSILLLYRYAIDRYMNTYKDKDFEKELFIPIYEPIENGIFSEALNIEILVPILMIGFNFESQEISENCSIVKMDDGIQLSRAGKIESAPEIHWVVAHKASHAILFSNYTIENSGNSLLNSFASVTCYPNDKIEEIFAAVRIVTGFNTGYAQILAKPTNWTFNYKATLPPLYGAITRSYPNFFDNGYWLQPTKVVTEEQSKKISEVCKQIVTTNNNRIRIALRRLNACFSRNNNEDRILDAAIGLESLFADDEKQEMTHKLALRVAAISKLDKIFDYNPTEIFAAIKKIYAYRSAVAHGSKDAEKKREIEIRGNKISTVELAIELLRKSLIVLLRHPEYLTPTKIDSDLLLGTTL